MVGQCRTQGVVRCSSGEHNLCARIHSVTLPSFLHLAVIHMPIPLADVSVFVCANERSWHWMLSSLISSCTYPYIDNSSPRPHCTTSSASDILPTST